MSHPRHRRRRQAAPCTTPRFEHDACGVGFVADAGGHSRDRVLPLALAGLAALGHRGAFGADGESSDGAGVPLPLDRSVLELLAGDGGAASGPAVVSLFLPRGRDAERGARALVEATFEEAGLTVAGWREVPVGSERARRGRGRRSRPAFAQAIVTARSRGADDPRPITDDAFERRLVIARRRPRPRARAAGGGSPSCRSRRSARTIVYKGLVAGGRLPSCIRTCGRPGRGLRGLPPALRHQHAPGLAARPAVPFDRPQRRDQHGPRQSRAGPRTHGAIVPRGRRPELLAAGPLLSPTAPTRCRSTRRSNS